MNKAEALQNLRERLLRERCDTEPGPVPGEGNPEAEVVFIGHAPGGTDAQKGRPYTGPNGELFDLLLKEAGLKREDFYITNLVKCWCWKEEHGQRINRYPTRKEINDSVLPWLQSELQILQPRGIVCLGTLAARFFLGKGFKISQQSGQWLELPPDSPYLKLTGGLPSNPKVMAIVQANYLTHLQAHAPEAYPDARFNLVADLVKIKGFISSASAAATPPSQETLPDTSLSDYSEKQLDKSLEQSFPASDPLPIGEATPIDSRD